MCGICGYWNRRSGRPADDRLIAAMTRQLRHRGPDAQGTWVDGDLALGTRRLKVVDPEGGRQPMPGGDGSVRLVFNGEIYNHLDLRSDLESRGYRFETRSDTETVAQAYREWGRECVERFKGMFALAAWDGRREQLFLARDRMGIKPLYVYRGREGIAFASELKSLVVLPWLDLEWDLEAIDDFMTYEYVPAPATVVEGVSKLRPGSRMTIGRGSGASGGAPERYWRPRAAASPPGTPEEAAAGLRRRLRASVERRLMADVPLGAFLSGGIDSSVVVALMDRELPGGVETFSIGFDDPSYDELPFARAVAERYGTRHHEEIVRPDAVELAGRLADFLDEPFADVSTFPTYLVSRLARGEVTVALSGDGGDELFAGYDQYRAQRWATRLRWLTRRRGWDLVDRILDRIPPRPSKKGPVNKAKRFAEGLRRPADLEHARWFVFWDAAERRALLSDRMRDRLAGRDPFDHYRERLREAAEAGFEGVQRQLYADLTGYLPDDILVKVDRMSMGTSLEARVPFLDHEVVEYAMAIPDRWKLRGGTTKWILRRAFGDCLPDAVLQRGKEGFSIPMKNWLRGPLEPLMRDLLDPDRVRDRGWFRADEVSRLVEEHVRREANHQHRLWCLMSLELSARSLRRRAAATGVDADVVEGSGASP